MTTTPTTPQDKKPAPPRDAGRPGIHPSNLSIPVAIVRFDRAIQYPGKQQGDMAKTEQEPKNGPPRASWQVDYLAAFRHFRITYTDHARKKPPLVGYVHEARALSWEPVS